MTVCLEYFPTSETALRMMKYISPIYNRSYVGKWIFEIMGMEMGEARTYFEELRQQAFPERTTWTVEYWERRYAIVSNPADSLENRRRNIIIKCGLYSPMNPAKMESVIDQLTDGCTTVVENVADYTFSVIIRETEKNLILNWPEVVGEIKKRKPSHQTFDICCELKPVVLENRQAFWFTALNISAWAENLRGLALERFRLHMRAEQAQGTALYLHTRSRMKQPQALAFSQLLVHLRGSNFPPGIIYLDGRRRLDGTWRLGQHGIRGPALHCFSARFRAVTRPVLRSTVRFRGQASARYGTAAGCVSRVNVRHTLRLAQPAVRVSLGAANRNTAAVFATADNRWYLDGTYRLDGEKRLNAEIRRSEL